MLDTCAERVLRTARRVVPKSSRVLQHHHLDRPLSSPAPFPFCSATNGKRRQMHPSCPPQAPSRTAARVLVIQSDAAVPTAGRIVTAQLPLGARKDVFFF